MKRARVTFLGDALCNPPMLEGHATADGYDFRPVFAPLRDLFSRSDLVVANLETPLSPNGADLTHEKWCFNSPRAYAEARRYLQIILASHLFSHLAFGLSALQRAEGGAIRSMTCMIVGFGVNLVLDPLLIFGCGMGVAGAAWATNIAMAASCLWAFSYYWRGKTVVRLRLRRIGFYPALMARTLGIGLAPFLQQLMSAVIVASLQIAFARWMPDKAARTAEIASLGVFSGALILIIMPVLGCQQGLQPILGYNWGARNYRRVLAAFKLGFWVTTLLTFLAFIIQVVPPFPTWIARMFVESGEPAIVALAAHDLQLANCMIWIISINVTATTYFQAIGRPRVAILLSLLRQFICLLPLVWILPHLIGDHVLAVWLALPISDIVAQLATLPPLVREFRWLKAKIHEGTPS